VLAAEHLFGLTGVYLRGKIVQRAIELIENRFAGFGPFGEHREILETLPHRFAEVPILFKTPAALQQLLRRGLILPEVGGSNAFFYAVEFIRRNGGVKDSSAGRLRGGSNPHTCEAVHPESVTSELLLNNEPRVAEFFILSAF
jgi:hypothetical protein